VNDPGKIQGPKLTALFNELIEKKTIISVSVVGTGFERLTCVVDLELGSEINYLLVDRPEGFTQAADQAGRWNLRFNFNGPDQLEYIFNTSCGELSGRNLKICFPNYVERLQRRKNFRITTLPGTYMVFAAKNLEGVIDLINISIGGAFGVLGKHNQGDLKGSIFKQDQRLYKVGIIFPGNKEIDEQFVTIKKAEVRRIEHDKERQLYKYAFEFMEVDKDHKLKLIQAIYHLQRHYLKNR
jgi:PilZ domain